MTNSNQNKSEIEFISHYVQNAPQIAWFLGAGTSRTAGMPTATDITWDLKRRYYCLQENQEIKFHDLNNNAVKNRIQTYLESKGFPVLRSAEEYSFYFELTFGKDYASQQKYLATQLSPEKISLNIGYRALAALIELDLTKMVFTTNFDDVLESAFSTVAEKSLSAYHLEGSYAALEALNAERFPIYAKLHGDFRYQSVKNLAADLLDNEEQIEKCFLAASNRFGIVVSGYSGRDTNVMAMFRSALEQPNSFPHGLFWTTTSLSLVPDAVHDLVTYARENNVRAEILETGTFDIMLSKIWRQIPSKNAKLIAKVQTARARPVCISHSSKGEKYPMLRTNALHICGLPGSCGSVECQPVVEFSELIETIRNSRPDAVITCADKILFWGNSDVIVQLFGVDRIKSFSSYPLAEVAQPGPGSTFLHSFYEHALSEALCHDKPVMLRKKWRYYYAVVNHKAISDPRLGPLKAAVKFRNTSDNIIGHVPGNTNTFWAEALKLKVDRRDDKWYLLVEPDIWVSPLCKREEVTNFLRGKKLQRYNNQAFQLLNAWIEIICGSIRRSGVSTVCYQENAKFSAKFELSTRTAYSLSGGRNE